MTNLSSNLQIKNLVVSVSGKQVLHGITLTIPAGEIHAIMGPNGSGKTTLAQVIMGHPKYKVESGEISYKGQNILTLTPDKRARLGLFLSFQNPKEIPGVKLNTFLRMMYNLRTGTRLTVIKFQQLLNEKMTALQIDPEFSNRYLNTGFSGGEKKKAESLQMALFEPSMAVLDETDSGLDIDALRSVCHMITTIREKTNMGLLLITHYYRILDYITPDRVHVVIDGRIVRSGGPEFAVEVEKRGYAWLTEKTTT